eukprot:4139619-Prymnesium_polylepis.1
MQRIIKIDTLLNKYEYYYRYLPPKGPTSNYYLRARKDKAVTNPPHRALSSDSSHSPVGTFR